MVRSGLQLGLCLCLSSPFVYMFVNGFVFWATQILSNPPPECRMGSLRVHGVRGDASELRFFLYLSGHGRHVLSPATGLST